MTLTRSETCQLFIAILAQRQTKNDIDGYHGSQESQNSQSIIAHIERH